MKITEAIFAICDTETTGLKPEKGDALVEIAATYWRYSAGIFGQPFEMLVDPERDIPATASAIHHLVTRDVAGEPTAAMALTMIDAYIGQKTICVAHNAEFDRKFLPVLEDRRWLCSKRLAQHVFPDAPAWNNQVLRYWFEGGQDLDLHGILPHRAAADIIVTAFNLKRTIDAYLESHADDVDQMLEFSASPVLFKRAIFGKHIGSEFSEIPKDYLHWMLRQSDMDADFKYTARYHLGQFNFGAA